jgi:DNA-binding MarR family transcriptional regulator
MDFGLGVPELKVLSLICERKSESVSGIASKLGIPVSVASRALRTLSEKGFVSLVRNGKRKEARLSDAAHARAFAELKAANTHINFTEVLSNSTMRVLSDFVKSQELIASGRVKEIALVVKAPGITVRRTLSKLLEKGIVSRVNGGYRIVLPRLGEFVRKFLEHALEEKCEGIPGSLIIVGPNALLRTNSEPNRAMALTGISVFGEYGVKVVETDYRDYCFNAFGERARKPCLEEAIVHSLVRSTLIQSAREVSYAMLVIHKNWRKSRKGKLLGFAKEFLVESETRECLDLVEKVVNGESWPEYPDWALKLPKNSGPFYPSRKEFEALVREYER